MSLLGPYFGHILVLWGDQQPKNKFKLRILDVFLLNLSQTLKPGTFYQTRRQGKRHLSPLGWKSSCSASRAGMVAAGDAAERMLENPPNKTKADI